MVLFLCLSFRVSAHHLCHLLSVGICTAARGLRQSRAERRGGASVMALQFSSSAEGLRSSFSPGHDLEKVLARTTDHRSVRPNARQAEAFWLRSRSRKPLNLSVFYHLFGAGLKFSEHSKSPLRSKPISCKYFDVVSVTLQVKSKDL